MNDTVVLSPDTVIEGGDAIVASGAMGALMGFGLTLLLLFAFCAFVWSIVEIVGTWKTLAKIGRPEWIALIPFWRTYELSKASMGDDRLTLALVILQVLNTFNIGGAATSGDGVGILSGMIWLSAFVLSVVMSVRLASAFGKELGFGIGLALLPPVFLCILGFGSARYIGPSEVTFEFAKSGKQGTPRSDI